MSTTKIEGFTTMIRGNTAYAFNVERYISSDQPSVLFIGSAGKPPVVFTEEEVKAMLRAAEDQVEEMTDGRLSPSFTSLAEKFGITLP